MQANFKFETKGSFNKLDAKTLRKEMRAIVMDAGKDVQSDFKFIQSHFSTKNRSKIRRKTGSGSPVVGQQVGAPVGTQIGTGSKVSGGAIYCAVGINEDSGQVLIWLEDGTKIRYRRLSADWISKSKGGLNFGPGKGKALGFDMLGFPGIEARNFRDAIVEKRYGPFIIDAQVRLLRLFRSNGWFK